MRNKLFTTALIVTWLAAGSIAPLRAAPNMDIAPDLIGSSAKVVLVDMPAGQDLGIDIPEAKTSAAKPSDVLKEEQAETAKKKPSTIDNIKELGTGFLKEIGDPGKFFTEVVDGYKNIYNQAIIDANAKRNARIARGETPTAWTDFKDGFTSSFVPSLTFSFKKWGLPAIKTVFGFFGKK